VPYSHDDHDSNDANRYKSASLLGDAAVEFAKEGLNVFPLARLTKVPRRGSAGLYEATDDIHQIREWWNADPYANIGVRTLRLAVVDLDSYQPQFSDSWDEFVVRTRPECLPATWVSRTGRGGSHYWYRLTDPEHRNLKNGYTSSLPIDGNTVRHPHIDLKCSGGSYVVAPPSVTHSGRYGWVRRGKLAGAPAWLRGPLPPSNRSLGAPPIARRGRPARRVAALLDLIAAAPVGERNSTLNWAAFRLADVVIAGMLSDDLARDSLLEAAADAGLPAREAERTIHSAFAARGL
jgi:hypothetical protein